MLGTTTRPLTNQHSGCIMAKTDLTAQRLRELLHYEPTTGIFTRVVPSRMRPDTAGLVRSGGNHLGYRQINVDGRQYQSHRVAWLYMTGSWPAAQIDHINGDGKDNRWLNLRDVEPRLNTQNQRRARADNGTGLLGVYPNHKRFMAKISTPEKRNMYLGTFDTPEEAHAAYLKAKRAYHAGCTI